MVDLMEKEKASADGWCSQGLGLEHELGFEAVGIGRRSVRLDCSSPYSDF